MKQSKPRAGNRKRDRRSKLDARPPVRERARLGVAAGLAIAALALGFAAFRWRDDNESASELRAEARRLLASDRAGQAEALLERAAALEPGHGEAWVLWLETMRAEDRVEDANRVGMSAMNSVLGNDRLAVLRSLTVALLTQAPDDQARTVLERWVRADPQDFQARTALLRRIAANPRGGDPDQAERIAQLRGLLVEHPDEPQIRAALVESLGDAGLVDEGESVLSEWPEARRDARYHRLRGRWDLDYRRDPARAVAEFRLAIEELPHDWRTRSQLSHALFDLKDKAGADREAREAARQRVILEPITLRRRLESDLKQLQRPESARDLAELCRSVGLTELAEDWN